MARGGGRWSKAAFWLIPLPPLFVLTLLALFASDAAHTDDWDLLPILIKARTVGLGPADYFEFHGPHRFVLPKLILTQVALATSWSFRAQLFVNFAFGVLALLGVAAIARSDEGARLRGLALLGSSLALFSLAQYDSWLWPWHIGYMVFMATLAGAVAVLVHRAWPVRLRVALAAVLCAIATFSIGFGAVSWIALAPLLAMETRRPRAALAVWGTVFLVCALLYRGAGIPSFDAHPGAGDAGLADFLLMFPAIAGSPWTTLPVAALATGAATLFAFGAIAWRAARKDLRGSMPWIALALAALGFQALTTVARARLGWEWGASTRYATPMMFMIVAMLHLGARLDPPRTRRTVVGVIVALLVVTNLTFVPIFLDAAAVRRVNRVCTELMFLVDAPNAECIPPTALNPRLTAQMTRARELGIRPFADESWFSDDARSPVPDVSLDAQPGAVTIRGHVDPALLPVPVVVTEGRERNAIAMVWAERDGTWQADLTRERIRGATLVEAWTIPGHEKRLVRIGRWRGGITPPSG